ncbi:MAG: hypothetical protein HWN66_18585 [Candidatus Helarchaeota archaeon]|nr:hypothetical protein [Candidatus Helarchaeota archaeon]
MSAEKEPPTETEEESAEIEPSDEEMEEERPKIIKKRKRKDKVIREIEPEADEAQLIFEITNLLKRARIAIAKENFIEAVKCYQDAAVAANMAGNTKREKIYLSRANELIKEHPELKEAGLQYIKKRKLKAKLREEEEKFSLTRMISNLIVAAIMLILVYSGIFGAIILQEILEEGASYSIPLLWSLSIVIEIFGIIVAYFFGTRYLRWSE